MKKASELAKILGGTLDGLAAYVRAQCATPKSRDRYFASVGLSRKRGKLVVTPL